MNARSWMERIGSRLILVVTLLIIISATWITSGRRPSEEDGKWAEPELSRTTNTPRTTRSIESSGPEPDTTEVAITKILKGNSKDDPFPANHVVELESNTVIALAPAATSQDKIVSVPSNHAPLDIAPMDEVDPTSIFNTVSMLSPNSGNTASADVGPSDFSSLEMLSLVPPLSAPENSGSRVTENLAPQTATPNAPVIDPNGLLPWLFERTSTLNHRLSTTPNGIEDWSKYIPLEPVNASPVAPNGI